MYKDHNDKFLAFTNVFRHVRYVLDKHAPLKNRSRLRSKYMKWPFRDNFLAYKKTETICDSLNKSTKEHYFVFISRKGFVSNKTFWNEVKPFLKNGGFLTNENIAIKCNGEIITDTTKLAGIFNTHYINIVEKSSATPPNIKGNPEIN